MDDKGNLHTYKWRLLMLLWVAYLLQQGTRQIYNAIIPQIQGDFNASSVQIGLVSTIFTFAYGLCVPFTGVLSDMLSRKWVVVCGVLLFSFGIFFSGAAAGIGGVIITYGLVNAVGQSFYYPPSSSLLGQAHSKTRSTALSILQTAQYAGIIICSCVAGYLADLKNIKIPEGLSWLVGGDLSGWRLPFFIFGAVGIAWSICLILFMRNTKQVSSDTSKPSFLEAFSVVLRRPSLLLLAVVFGSLVYIDIGFKTWIPTYLYETFSMDLTKAAFHSVIWVYAGAFIGVIAGSAVCDRLFAKFKNIRFSLNMIGFACIAPFLIVVANTGNLKECIAGLFMYGFFKGVCDSCIFASVLDVAPVRFRASGMSIMICGGFLIGSTSSTILGFIRHHFSLSAGIESLSIFCLVNVLVLYAIIRFFLKRDFVQPQAD